MPQAGAARGLLEVLDHHQVSVVAHAPAESVEDLVRTLGDGPDEGIYMLMGAVRVTRVARSTRRR